MKVITAILVCALLLIERVTAQSTGSLDFGYENGVGSFGRNSYVNNGDRSNYGVSSNCPTVCTAIYTPTCGFNGICYRSFGNSCELARAACTGQGNFQQVLITECSRLGARMC